MRSTEEIAATVHDLADQCSGCEAPFFCIYCRAAIAIDTLQVELTKARSWRTPNLPPGANFCPSCGTGKLNQGQELTDG